MQTAIDGNCASSFRRSLNTNRRRRVRIIYASISRERSPQKYSSDVIENSCNRPASTIEYPCSRRIFRYISRQTFSLNWNLSMNICSISVHQYRAYDVFDTLMSQSTGNATRACVQVRFDSNGRMRGGHGDVATPVQFRSGSTANQDSFAIT